VIIKVIKSNTNTAVHPKNYRIAVLIRQNRLSFPRSEKKSSSFYLGDFITPKVKSDFLLAG
jgi:hypothetical protein